MRESRKIYKNSKKFIELEIKFFVVAQFIFNCLIQTNETESSK